MRKAGRRRKKIKYKKFYIILLAITSAAFLLSLLLRKVPHIVESVYSRFLYKVLSQVIGWFGIFLYLWRNCFLFGNIAFVVSVYTV